MQIAFICGPYRAPNAWEVERNIRRAEEAAFQLCEMGFGVICPHTNTRFFNGTLTDAFWLRMTTELMLRCDFVVTLDGWDRSEGSVMEVRTASAHGLPVHSVNELGDIPR